MDPAAELPALAEVSPVAHFWKCEAPEADARIWGKGIWRRVRWEDLLSPEDAAALRAKLAPDAKGMREYRLCSERWRWRCVRMSVAVYEGGWGGTITGATQEREAGSGGRLTVGR